jgi:phage terminase large subunit-like protein
VDYAKRVIAGKEPACLQVRQAAARFIADFDRKDIEFRTSNVDHVCNFVSDLVHVKGEWAGKPIKLEPFQVFILANIFGWIEVRTGKRRYRTAFILLPRKNGKSLLAAAIGLYMTFADGEAGAEGYSGATSLDQAKEVFSPAKLMAEMTPGFAEALDVETAKQSIFSTTTGSSFRPVIANTRDGASPHIAICDELHQARDDTQINAFRTGMGARSQPLLMIISTAGVNLAGVCRTEQLDAEAVLAGTKKNDRLFALIYTTDPEDDWRDVTSWQKANPNWGVSVGEQYLRDALAEGLQSPAKQAAIRTKHLNQWVSSAAGWLNQTDWTKAADSSIVIPADAPVWIGVDLAVKTDITAACMVAVLPDGRRAVVPSLFLPTGALDRSINAPAYVDWIDSGALISTEGEASDHEAVEAHIRELCTTYNVQGVLFDPWQSASMSQRLAKDGVNVMEFAQRATTFSPVMTDFEADLMNSKIVHNDNPCMNWMAQNASIRMKGPFKSLGKPTNQDHLRIDGIIAALMAYAPTMEEETVVSTPDIFFF